MFTDGASVGSRPADRLAESGGVGRGPHRGDLRNLRARDSLTETTLLRTWDALQKLRKIIEVFALEPVRGPTARSFSEEGEILSESLVRILTGLNRDLEALLRARRQ